MKGSEVVWPVCDLQWEWVWDKMIGKNRMGKCGVCAGGGERRHHRLGEPKVRVNGAFAQEIIVIGS